MGDGEFLARLSEDDKLALVQAGRTRNAPARSRLFEQGDPGYEVLIVEEGAVKLHARVERRSRDRRRGAKRRRHPG